MKFTMFCLLVSATNCVLGHYYFPYFILNDTWSESFEYVRKVSGRKETLDQYGVDSPEYNIDRVWPLTDPSSPDLRCGRNASVLQQPVNTARVRAGDTVGFGIQWRNSQGIFHPGPGSAWLSRTPEGVDLDGYEGDGDWFKFFQIMGRTEYSTNYSSPSPYWSERDGASGEAKWGLYVLTSYNFTIPKTTPAGGYLLRWEHLYALKKTAQFFVNCAHVEIVNDGVKGTPAPLVKIPGHYVFGQPDVYFNAASTDPKDIAPPKPDPWVG